MYKVDLSIVANTLRTAINIFSKNELEYKDTTIRVYVLIHQRK